MDSYGYRPNRSAHDAIRKTRERCWHYNYHPAIPFECYADDAICYCNSLEKAQRLKSSIVERFAVCKL